jgi:septum formation protein
VSGDRPTLVLASASPARRETLLRAGIQPLIDIADIDEPGAVAANGGDSLSGAQVALLLARLKAETVAARRPAALVLGCDSVLELDGEVHGKPADASAARERWARMSGREGVLHTGHWVIDTRGGHDEGAPAYGEGSATTVRFAEVSLEEIAAYVETGEPLRVAGAFTLDGLGGAFVRGVDGDPHGVVGLSLPLLRDLLARFGVRWTDLWDASLRG